jgi:uncharacterized membrane protein
MASIRDILAGFGLGAGLMYWFDPARGRYRRAKVRDQMIHTCHQTEGFINRGLRDLNNRLHGVTHEVRRLATIDHPNDRTLEQRVRAKMGRYVSHPHAIDVMARSGCVTVRGPILEHEVDDFLGAVASVRGVRTIENELSVHAGGDGVSSLQGRGVIQGEPSEFLQENWAPATRLLASGLGTGLMLNCLARRTPSAILWGTLGFGLFVRATSNLPVQRLTSVGARRCAVTLQRTYHIDAPLDRVFNFIIDWKQCARFLPHIKDFEEAGDGRFRWKIHMPGGADLQLEDEVTCLEPNECVEWRSAPGSPIAFEGRARFEAEGENRTRIDVHLSYNPPAGALGHAAASLLGWDAKTQMEQSFLRVKTYLETGKLPRGVEAAVGG